MQPIPERIAEAEGFHHALGQINTPLRIDGIGRCHLLERGLMMIIDGGMQGKKHGITRLDAAQPINGRHKRLLQGLNDGFSP